MPSSGFAASVSAPASGPVLVVHAHPDDEVFATGAATLAARAADRRVILRVLTGGEGRSASLSPSGLREARRRKADQLDRSASLLGISEWDYVDEGRWLDTPQRPSRTLASASIDDIASALVATVASVSPRTILTVGPDGLTGHPDHRACYQAILAATKNAAALGTEVLGAVVRSTHVEAAQARAQSVIGAVVGSGRTTGSGLDGGALHVAHGPADTESLRRQALDGYSPGMGTGDVAELLDRGPRTSDSLLMRMVLDHRGWDHDTFMAIAR